MNIDHLIFQPGRISSSCHMCGKYAGESPHVSYLVIFCAGCCPFCGPVSQPDTVGPVTGLIGDQEALF